MARYFTKRLHLALQETKCWSYIEFSVWRRNGRLLTIKIAEAIDEPEKATLTEDEQAGEDVLPTSKA
jgi:hypothetical protein